METVGLGQYWNNLEPGQTFKTVGRTITEVDIITFINCTGMVEVMFTDIEYIMSKSAIKGRVVPAALVYAMSEGLLIQATMQNTGLAFLNMELNVEKPCMAGDTIHCEVEVIEVRPTSKGNRGLVRTRNTVKNQKGETLLTYTPLRMIAGRPEA